MDHFKLWKLIKYSQLSKIKEQWNCSTTNFQGKKFHHVTSGLDLQSLDQVQDFLTYFFTYDEKT
jgi:hypothetical protein